MKHTPTPWEIKHLPEERPEMTHIIGADGYDIATLNHYRTTEDSAFIIRACNMHNELVDAALEGNGTLNQVFSKLVSGSTPEFNGRKELITEIESAIERFMNVIAKLDGR